MVYPCNFHIIYKRRRREWRSKRKRRKRRRKNGGRERGLGMCLNGGALAYMYSTLGSIPDTESKKEK
jgi:hypothetical protein